MTRLTALLCATTACMALNACTLVKLNTEAKTFYESTVLAGRIDAAPNAGAPIIVAAYRHGASLQLTHRTLLHEAGSFELIVPAGEYGLFAFSDSNRNGAYDAGEPAGEYEGAQPVVASGTGVVAMLDFTIGGTSGVRPQVC